MALCACIGALSGCMEKDVYQGIQEEKKEYNEFDFSTIASSTSLEVSYLNCGVEAAVYFELYDEIPVTKGEYSYIKRDDVTPLFAAYTGENGVYSGTVELPAYLKEVYVYTPAFFAQTLIEAEVTNGSIVAKDDGMAERATTRVHSGNGDSYMVTNNPPAAYSDTRWKTWLGDYKKHNNGEIQYQYENTVLGVGDNFGSLYTAHSKVVNVNGDCPNELRSYRDMYVSKDAEVAVTFLGGNTCWNSSMGYYYYKGEKPASLNEANVIMLFPNTQDGKWTVGNSDDYSGINRGTTVQLKYYPNIATDSKDGENTTFPAGYRIGLVLATNAWNNRVPGYQGNKRYRSATSQSLSMDDDGNAISVPRTAVYSYDGYVMISFEDYKDDNNFSDVVVTMTSNPADAITTEIPTVDPNNNHTTTNILKGIYAFEDMWPSTGDYDLNDVMVRYNYEKTFDSSNKIYSEAFIFKTFQNYASLTNGLAFKVLNNSGVEPSSVKCEIRRPGEDTFTETTEFAYELADNVYRLTDNIKPNLGAEYKVTLTYNSPITTESGAQAFIYRNTANNGKRWEMHIAKEKPTSLMDETYYGNGDDASNPDEEIYFVRDGIYPFGIFLAGADENDLDKMLDHENESNAISDMYSGYAGWVTSGGISNPDWYKE